MRSLFSPLLLRRLLLLRVLKSVPSSSSPSIRFGVLTQKRDLTNLSLLSRLSSTTATDPRSASLRSDPSSISSGGAGMAAVAGEGSAARRFWIAGRKETIFASYTPFIVLLAAGKLDMDTFRSYMAQDVYFLKAFAQAYEMAAECADDDDDVKDALYGLHKSVLDELKLHGSVMQEWGMDPTKEITPNSITLKYTEFLLGIAAGKINGGKGHANIVTPFEKTKIAAYTVGAMTPCMRLYAFLGKELQSYLQDVGNDHPFKKWIDTYSSRSFEASAMQIEDLLDKLSVPLTGGELEMIEKLYLQAMKLEIEFFNAQPIIQPVVVPFIKLLDSTNHLVIFSDFDLTCTVLDSCAVLAEIAILTASKVGQGVTDALSAQRSPTDVRNSWDELSKQYTEEYEQRIESMLPTDQAKTFDYDSLCKSLEKLSDFEKGANSRVIKSGLLKGLNLEDIKKAGERLILQDGCKEFFQKAIKIKENFNADFHILSYCWCADLIRSSFSSVGCLNDLSIHSNEFQYEGSISTGEFVTSMESPIDKVNQFKGILAKLGREKKHLSVYIGDSVGDLLCLLEADVGIVIGSSSSLRRVGEKFGVTFTPLYPGLITKQRDNVGDGSNVWKGLSGVLYTASSWTDVHAFILGA